MKLFLSLFMIFTINIYAQSLAPSTVVNDAVDNVYKNNFTDIEFRNACYRLGYLKSQIELLRDHSNLKRKSNRNLKKALKKLKRGVKLCKRGTISKGTMGAIIRLIVPGSRIGKSIYKSVGKLLRAKRFNRDVDEFSYSNRALEPIRKLNA